MAPGKITERVDAITHIGETRRTACPPAPKSVKIELTARCNYRCSFCATGQKLRVKSDMSRDFYLRILEELKAIGVEEIGVFYLGESFLLPWLPQAIRDAKEAGFDYVFLTTNGSLATPERVQACLEAGLDSLKFSLNYADAEQFVSVARVKGRYFDAMIENVKAARRIRDENGFDCGLYASYISYDGDQGARMESLMAELSPYLDEFYALPLYSQADLVAADGTSRGWRVRGGNPGRADAIRPPVPCWSLFTEGRISYDGHLSACCFDHDGRFRMGDLNAVSFMQAWHSEPFQALRAAHLTGDVRDTVCNGCVSYE